MADEDPYAEYEAASPELRKLIEKQLARRNRHKWFQNFIQLLSVAGGIVVTLYIIKVTGEVIAQGKWATAVGGSALGGSTVVALARLYTNAYNANAIISDQSARKRTLPPVKKAAIKRTQPQKRTPAKRNPPAPPQIPDQ